MIDFSKLSNLELSASLLGEVGDESALRGCAELLGHALPGEHERMWTKAQIVAIVVELAGLLARASLGGSIDDVDAASLPASDRDAEFRYYRGHAKHSRSEGPGVEFTGTINLVRVVLPDRQPAEDFVIETAIGLVRAKDHGELGASVFSREQIQARYAQRWPESPRRAHAVELYTGGLIQYLSFEQTSSRFVPVALFLARDAQGRPLYFVAQSGYFNGRPGRLYVAESATDLTHESGFKPTPFAHPENHYHMRLELDGDQPKRLIGEMHTAKSEKPYLAVALEYEPLLGPPRSNSPLRAQVIAFARVCAIENWLGREHFRQDRLEMILHEAGLRLGKLLPWWDQK